MTFLAQPRQFTLPEFQAYVQSLKWNKGWRPSFITGHNTAIPRLTQYLAYTPEVRRKWPGYLNDGYKLKGWHSGPHIVICPQVDGGGIWLLCDPEQDGVSVSCWNHLTFGIENVGDFETEDPTTGHGAEVRDQFVGVVAALSNKLGLRPRPHVVGRSGVHWHHECARDHHPCPGKNWDGDDVIARIETAMGLKVPAPPPAAAVPQSAIRDAFWLQATLNSLGTTPRLDVDGDIGDLTKRALSDWQLQAGQQASDPLSPSTIAMLEHALAAKAA